MPLTSQERNKLTLEKYLPQDSVADILHWQEIHKFQLKITKDRKSKLGDFRPPQHGYGYRISINRGLNKYNFLLTLVHEIAHLVIWEKYKNKVQPHGSEWKQTFKILMTRFLNGSTFPEELERAIAAYLIDPAASSCRDEVLMKILRKWDENPATYLEELAAGTTFVIPGGRIFIKGEKRRKRYICIESSTNRKYLFSPVAEVNLVK